MTTTCQQLPSGHWPKPNFAAVKVKRVGFLLNWVAVKGLIQCDTAIGNAKALPLTSSPSAVPI